MLRGLHTRSDPVDVTTRMHARLRRHGVDVPVRLWDDTMLGPNEASYRLVLHQPWTLRSMLPVSDLAAGEAYIAGELDIACGKLHLQPGERLLDISARVCLSWRVLTGNPL